MLLLTATNTFAQSTNSVNGIDSTPIFQGYLLLVSLSGVFLIIIIGLSRILSLLKKLETEPRSNSSFNKAMVIAFLLLAGNNLMAQNDTRAKAHSTVNADSPDIYNALMVFVAAEIAVIVYLIFKIRKKNSQLALNVFKVNEPNNPILAWWSSLDQTLFTKATPIEKEADVLLDHDYDGIKELDNALPPWWKYGFYVTIVVGFIYFLNFHVWHIGKNPTEEYLAEIENAKIEKAKYDELNKDKIDEEHVPMASADGIASGKEIFHRPAMCSTCHGQLGEGGAGPNLTDDYWIHKGSLNDIYHSIKNGYPDKGMQSWQNKFTPKEISYLASYIKSLRGSNPPNAQAPKGELYIEASGDSISTAKKDTTSAAVIAAKGQ
jgi:cytochrome c oxidase cbb3-type subunit 3